MKFTSTQDLLERVDLNAKAADVLGLSGALGDIESDLNELEASQWAKDLLAYQRAKRDYESRLESWAIRKEKREQRFREAVEARNEKTEARIGKYQERVQVWKQEVERREKENERRRANGKKELKIPERPTPPRRLAEIKIPSDVAPPAEPEFPARPKIILSQRDRIKLQRNVLNLYLSGHPLDEAPEDPSATKIRDIESIETKSTCAVQGVLLSHKVTTTRTKKLMARLRIEDKTGSIEVVAFPPLYSSVQGMLADGEIYRVFGEVDKVATIHADGSESSHSQLKGLSLSIVRIGSDKEWDIMYPALIGTIRILPTSAQTSKDRVMSLIMQHARE